MPKKRGNKTSMKKEIIDLMAKIDRVEKELGELPFNYLREMRKIK